MSPSEIQSADLASTCRLGAPSVAAPPRVLILGYGNPGRQDDGLGPAVAEQIDALGWPNVTAYENYQLNIEDALEVADHDVVWFVDAARSGPSAFAFAPLAPAASLEFTSHLVRPEAILAMAHRYYGAAPQAFLLGIRGYEFEFAEGLTIAARENLKLAVEMLKGRLGASQPSVTS
jgi:hydrogenase maturation protease